MKRNALKTMLATLLCLGLLATSALAQTSFNIIIGVPPPPPRHEVYLEERPGYVLLPGYWFWDGHQHRWAEHHWVEARPGQHWTPPRWEPRGKKHRFEPGRWEPDQHENQGRRQGQGHRGNPGQGHGQDNDGRR
ncbi:MAG: YXWGXW repeat-containing protein [Humidesulfovibrio sp.]|nr:YXWGXW repeat-containing protein [Humidesulfovibrio sp.]